jgi:guanylate cyclase soluble subunit beta
MYGLIHTALREMVLEHHGEQTWEAIVIESGVPTNSFLTMRSYDDETTLALIGAASKILALPLDRSLEAFGEYWISSFAPKEYGRLLDHTGDSPIEFLQNLDDLHDRISTSFTNFMPPSFRVDIMDANTAVVRYSSNREGLTPFVIGILEGLGKRFGTSITVSSIEPVEVPRGEQSNITISMVKASD